MFSSPDFIANLSDGLKIIDPIFITCDDIDKLFLSQVWNIWSSFLVTLTRCLFCSSVNRCGTPSSKNISDFQCFIKIRWTVDCEMSIFRAISQTVNLASPSMISFILKWLLYEMQVLAYLILVHVWWTLHLIQIYFSSDCVIRHARRSLCSRKFSHQLFKEQPNFERALI